MSSRSFVFLIPLIVIVAFWYMAKRESQVAHDPTHRSYWERNGTVLGVVFIGLVAFWTLFLVVLPYLYMAVESFHPKLPPAKRGGAEDLLTIANYTSFFWDPHLNDWNWTHMQAFAYSIYVSAGVTIVNLVVCYPLAYYMAQSGAAQRVRLLLLALIVPYWINEILRSFSIKLILASNGLINSSLMSMGLINNDSKFDFLLNNTGMWVGLSYANLLIMMFPLYNAIESLDKNQIEAARDLGAPWWKIHRDVVIPYAKPGIASGCTMVFMLAAGSLAAPQLLGGPRTLWFTSTVYEFFNASFNWARGSAYAFILLMACIIIVMVMLRLFKVKLGEAIR